MIQTIEGRSLTKRGNKLGPRTVSWGTPDSAGDHLDEEPFTTTRCPQPVKKARSQLFSFPDIKFGLKEEPFVIPSVSKAFAKSRKITSTWPWMLRTLTHSWITVINWVGVLFEVWESFFFTILLGWGGREEGSVDFCIKILLNFVSFSSYN